MFTSHSALIISSIFGVVIILQFTIVSLEKAIDLFKRLRD